MPVRKKNDNMVVGIKQTLRMIEQNCITEVFIAKDADFYVSRHVLDAAKAAKIPIRYVESKKKLGHLCGIEIGAATAGTLKKEDTE